ncbi:hypothetical protein K0U91_06745 [Chryseobacterium chendengshani]|uniref:hypothetical protein n=1 Tax=Chryseobacterium sp. LJ668 TaxID=2864040 RepID=UPI001C68D03E|nr:hypothetical protein [Chryseobacterium sp. LJ668]MBW8522164.1 hypothetical protein [Chryseobacterium sp. LJ668]QYK17810.1 hypothetical protein K0U91_06745 [Chryseobacterium sp. LJ668]
MSKSIVYVHCQYKKSKILNTYDIVGDKIVSDIPFIRVETPNEDFLKKQRAKFVIQSFKNRKKILFTGLIPIGHNYYYGDNVKPNNKKDFLVIYYNSIRSVIHLYIFENRSPRKKADFANDFVYHLGHIGKLPNNI